MPLTMQDSALSAITEARDMIYQARQHAEQTAADAAASCEIPDMDAAVAAYHEQLTKVSEMEASFLRSIETLAGLANGAEMTVSRDGQGCLYFGIKNGFNGGVIFHASWKDGERQPYGTWSVHI